MNFAELNSKIDWKKVDQLIPVIVQDYLSAEVLMLGYMNSEALEKTITDKKLTFFSRTKKSLWTKGETSGNYLNLKSIEIDCDQDTILAQVYPQGPTCHQGTTTCFTKNSSTFLASLVEVISDRKKNPLATSYVSALLQKDTLKVLQKVGEEAVEFTLAATSNDEKETLSEAADLLFHLLVALEKKELSLKAVLKVLDQRQK